jgi:two-component system phosphate regulon sensor histidine kinase PhoR
MARDAAFLAFENDDMIRHGLIRAVLIFACFTLFAWLMQTPLAASLVLGLIGAFLAWQASPMAEVPPLVPPVIDPPIDRTADLIDAIDDVLLILDRQRIIHANAAAVALFGADKLDGDVRLALRHPQAAEMLADDNVTRNAGPVELTGIVDQVRYWLLNVRHIGGDLRLVSLRDRTESRLAERMRVDFVANASHELRTPLATILGFIETLSDEGAGSDEATRSRFLKIMHGEAKRMQQLVDDLISLSRIEADRYAVPQSPVALAPLIEEVVGVMRAGGGEAADRVMIDIADSGASVRADRVQIGQLLHNLIGNAIKYGRPGTPVRVKLRSTPERVRLTVIDEGEGIAAEHLPRLTERFYRVDAGRSRSVGGTGLGLAIVKHIVERHRATLDIASTLGEGTIISVTFPAFRAETLS